MIMLLFCHLQCHLLLFIAYCKFLVQTFLFFGFSIPSFPVSIRFFCAPFFFAFSTSASVIRESAYIVGHASLILAMHQMWKPEFCKAGVL